MQVATGQSPSPAPQPRTPSQSDTYSGSDQSQAGPITPAQALKRYADHMTNFEQSEVLEYPHVFFLGRSPATKIKGNPHGSGLNFG